MRIFIGYDSRQPIAYSVLQHSIISRSSKPVQITPLILGQLPIEKRGLTEFTYSRFLVPWLCNYEGKALFLDADMLCLGDIGEVFSLFDESFSVQLIKNKRHFEWPSMMLFNNRECWRLTPQYIEKNDLYKMDWGAIGELPQEWNHCIGYDPPKEAKLVHFTKGIPVWDETRNCEYAEDWHQERRSMMGTCSFNELMGKSIHVA